MTTSYDDGRPFMRGDRIAWAPGIAQPGDPTYIVAGPAPEGWVVFTPTDAELDDVDMQLEAAPDELVHLDPATSYDDAPDHVPTSR